MLYLSHDFTYQLLSYILWFPVFVCMHVSLHVYELLVCFICFVVAVVYLFYYGLFAFLFLCFPKRENEGLELDMCEAKDMPIKVQNKKKNLQNKQIQP